MWYRYLFDFGHGISVLANFSFGIAVLDSPQFPLPYVAFLKEPI